MSCSLDLSVPWLRTSVAITTVLRDAVSCMYTLNCTFRLLLTIPDYLHDKALITLLRTTDCRFIPLTVPDYHVQELTVLTLKKLNRLLLLEVVRLKTLGFIVCEMRTYISFRSCW